MKRILKLTGSWLLLFGLMLGLLPSCDYSYFEIEELPDYHYRPVFALPLVNSSLGINDLVPDDDTDLIWVGPDQLISLVYSDKLFSTLGSTLFQISDNQFNTSFSASPSNKNPNETITRAFSFSTGAGDELDSIAFREGTFMLQLSAPGIQADGYQARVHILIPGSFNQAGEPFSMVVPANGSAEQSLEGYTFTFYNDAGDSNLFDVHYQVEFIGNGNPVNAPYQFSLQQHFSSLLFDKIFGILAPRALNLGGMGIDIGIFDSEFDGQVSFLEPRVHLSAYNSFGFDIELQANDLNFEGPSETVNLTGFPAPWLIASPELNQAGLQVYSGYELNKDNSNVVAAIENQPHTLYSNFSAQLNPAQNRSFALWQSQLSLKVDVELPLYGTASGFSLRDTIELSRNDSITEIEWIELLVDVVNGLPVDLFLQLEFANENYQVDAVLFEGVTDFNLIESGQVDGQGNVTVPRRKTTRIFLNEAQTMAFLNSPMLILSARLQTPDDGNIPVKIFDYQALEVRIGARVKGNVIIEF